MKTCFDANCDTNFSQCTLTCHSNLQRSQNTSIDGVVMNSNCYTYLLILLEVSIKDPAYEDHINPKAISLNCLDYALIYDEDFIEDCKQATLHDISKHQKVVLKAFEEELAPPMASVALNCREL